MVGVLGGFGRAILVFLGNVGNLTLFSLRATRTAVGALLPAGRLRPRMVVTQAWLAGASALPIAGLIGFMIGVILALQSAVQLERLGAERYVASLVAVAITRELGPVLTAIVVAGRSGSAIAAEISSMKIQEEIDALEVMGINVMSYLVAPRFLALLITLPLLTALCDAIGILGGLIASMAALDVPAAQYFETAREAVKMKDFVTGLTKAAVFGANIAVVGAWCGHQVTGGPEGVGKATTRAVVLGIFLIFVNDLLFTSIFFRF